jgi:superfamily II DNA or RNA helicase/diadenosine tetraphosphate (Ap4A) HIT family hydrolase/HKD family nuclease
MSVFLTIDPSEWVDSNDLAFAIRDKFPVSPGHTLVIPKRVIATWWEATREEQQAIFDLVDRVKEILDHELSPDGYNVGFNAGAAAGQTIDHLHIHVIPRYAGDMTDPRGGVRHVIPSKGNYLALPPTANPTADSSLITPMGGRLRLELVRCMIREDLDQIDLVVSFIKRSGVDLLAHTVDLALERGARIRLLTTDYLQITDAGALGFFLDRVNDQRSTSPNGNLSVRVFSDPATSFHPKAYIFTSSSTGAGVAFVGSSNLSRSGISKGVEWNIQTSGTTELVTEFERLWNDQRSLPLTDEWLEHYEEVQRTRREAVNKPGEEFDALVELAEEEPEDVPRPWSVQREGLSALEATRIEGHQAGLVVMATGLGKTWLAAFDSTRPEFRRVLFIAHREEILTQTRDVYRRIRPTGRLTMFTGHERDPDGDVVFASVQSLQRNLSVFDPEQFDYIVVDEFHHAAARTYRQVLGYFRPRFMLGLTATPSRGDNADLLALCGDNLVYDCGLVEGVKRDLLSPFTYRAIPDVADYEQIPWRNGRFDPDELTKQVATIERAQQVFEEWLTVVGDQRRALGFCCTITHADFMAEYFRERGVHAVSVHSGHSSAPRVESLEQLASGDISVIFTVDLFNEGVDVPAIDLVMMLRPTESSVIFLQQLGRGLRRAENKESLRVIDLVGNHRSFLLKARLLVQLAGYRDLTDREAVKILADNASEFESGSLLPEGCSIIVDPEVVNLLGEMLGPLRERDRMIEAIRSWVDEHEGRRPTALEMAVHTGRPLDFKSRGGWFGVLRELGLFSAEETKLVSRFQQFFLWIEHGSYTKSYKLVTLNSILDLDGFRTPVAIADLASSSRWAIFKDPALLNDLSDAGSQFGDPMNPTVEEWERYWRRNPINALTSSSKGQDPWFVEQEGHLKFVELMLEDEYRAFADMTQELVEYRLHRYLIAQTAKRTGDYRKPYENGVEIDATFSVEGTAGIATSVVIESAGGKAGSASARNTEYPKCVDLVLQRLANLDAQVLDAYIETGATTTIPLSERRLTPGNGLTYPLTLSGIKDLAELRQSLLRSMSKVGQSPIAKGGGNQRKRFRIVLALPDPLSQSTLADRLASQQWPADSLPQLKPDIN